MKAIRSGGKKWMRVKDAKLISDPSPSDTIILVMGPTGVGKSTFINTAVGQVLTEVSHRLRSCTKEIVPIAVSYPRDEKCRIVFVDTPGFDDTFEADTEILKRVANWMERSYKNKNKVAGIVYLYEISQARMLGTSRKNFTMFNKLCGKEVAKNIVLVTTKWAQVDDSVGREREQELSEVYWKQMLDRGLKADRFKHSDHECNRVKLDYIQIQRELLDLRKRLPETYAGKALREELKELLEDQKALAQALQDAQGRTPEWEAKRNEAMKRMRSTLEQAQQLKIPLGRRVASFFGFG